MEDRLNWLIFGAGAIGTYVGGSLILHGQNVSFIEQSAISGILERGLRLDIQGQEHRILHPDIYSTLPEALTHSSFDVAIFALKSYDTQEALEAIRPYVEYLPPLLCLQNGVENELALEEVLGKGKVIAGVVTSAIQRRAVGDIRLERLRGIGLADGHPLSLRIANAFSEAGLNPRLLSSASAMKWSKMLTNLMANASSAILDMPPADILAHPDLYAVEVAQLREAIQVCHLSHIQIVDLPDTPVRLYAWIIRNFPLWLSRPLLIRFAGKGRGEKMPSFHMDLHSGRGKSEVDYLNGAVVRFGESLNIPTPVNGWLNKTLLMLTQGTLPLEVYSHQPEKYCMDINPYIEKSSRL